MFYYCLGREARTIQGGEMTHYERLKNVYDRNVYCSPDERKERFRNMLEAEERRRMKEEYLAEIRKDQEEK